MDLVDFSKHATCVRDWHTGNILVYNNLQIIFQPYLRKSETPLIIRRAKRK
jgi:hypothetical protein